MPFELLAIVDFRATEDRRLFDNERLHIDARASVIAQNLFRNSERLSLKASEFQTASRGECNDTN